LLWFRLLLSSLILLTSVLLLVFPQLLSSLLLLRSPDVQVVSCAAVEPPVYDNLAAVDVPDVPAVASVSAVAAVPTALEVPFHTDISNVFVFSAVEVDGVPSLIAVGNVPATGNVLLLATSLLLLAGIPVVNNVFAAISYLAQASLL
jgi:hypothetical protein